MPQDFPSQMREFYGKLDPLRKGLFAGASVLGLLAIAGVGLWASQPGDVILTRAGDTDEAEGITRALSQAEIPYSLDLDGRTIRVPAEFVVKARSAATTDGGILGLEGLDQIDPWATPFQEQLYQQRMMQGELVRTINTISGVASSTVHLTLPERSAFLRDELRATASVTLRPDPGTSLDRNIAHSIGELVSHSVNGMTASDVTVVDSSSGRTLWGESDPTGQGASSDLGSLAAAREVSLANGARASLARLLGNADAATVNVHVELETAAVQQTVNAVDPDSQVASSERSETESDSRGSSQNGVPGTDANLPERSGASAGVGVGRSRETNQTSYSFSSTTTTTTRPAGDIRRITASVMIDTVAIVKLAAGGDEAAVRASVEEAVKASLGASDKRGDQIQVTFVPFAPPADAEAAAVAEATAAAETAADNTQTIGLAAAGGVGVLLLIGAVLFALKKRPANAAAATGTTPALAPSAAGMPLGANAVLSPRAQPAAANNSGPDFGQDTEYEGDNLSGRLRAKLERLEPHNPQQVSDLVRKESEPSAEVLRRWIHA